MKLSAFFPCHNEAPNIGRVLREAAEVLRDLTDEFELIVIDDGSADETAQVARRLDGAIGPVRVISHETNRGYGAALRSGLAAARLDYVFFTDGDGQFDVRELRGLLPYAGDFDLVIGYRQRRHDPLPRVAYGKLYGMLLGILLGLRVRDVNCAFKLIRRDVLGRVALRTTGALTTAELLIGATRAGCRIKEVPVSHFTRTAGEQSGGSPRVILKMFVELFKFYRLLGRSA